jgi:hypothetical protein
VGRVRVVPRDRGGVRSAGGRPLSARGGALARARDPAHPGSRVL